MYLTVRLKTASAGQSLEKLNVNYLIIFKWACQRFNVNTMQFARPIFKTVFFLGFLG